MIRMGLTAAVLFLAAPRGEPAGGAAGETAALQPTHQEVENIGTSGPGKLGELSSLCTTADDRLMACDAKSSDIKVFDTSGKHLGSWAMPFAPYAICAAADGTVFVGGIGKLAKLDKDGKALKTADVAEPLTTAAGSPPTGPRAAGRPLGKASGMAVLGDELFVSFGAGWSLRAKGVIVRFGRDLGSPQQIARDLNGCCQRLDLEAVESEKVLYVAENARYRVVKMDREGKVLGSWGERSRTDPAGFGACCNPMNLCFDRQGVLYTAESGLGRVKRHTTDGKLLSLVGEVGVTRFEQAGGLAASCSNIAVAVSADGQRIFVQDVKTNCIRVLAARK